MSVLLACLCLAGCRAQAPEPDPAQAEAAAIAARRAEGEAAIRAKRAEFAEARKPTHLGRKAQEDAYHKETYSDADRREQARYDACVQALRTNPTRDCRVDAPARRPSTRP